MTNIYFLKTLLTGVSPDELFLLSGQLCQWSSYFRKVLNKPSVIACQTQKTSDFCHICWSWPIHHCFYLPGVNLYAIFANSVT